MGRVSSELADLTIITQDNSRDEPFEQILADILLGVTGDYVVIRDRKAVSYTHLHKVLLFSQFTSMLDLIRERLAEQNTKYYCLTGNTDKQERQRLVDAFQNDDTPVFLISLKAGGTGLNLTAADIVIHYDPWWNVAAQNQATDRAHRIGQKNTVTVYRLIAKDSLEEGIIKLQESKKALSDDILSMDFGAIASMSKDELLALLSTGEVANQAK